MFAWESLCFSNLSPIIWEPLTRSVLGQSANLITLIRIYLLLSCLERSEQICSCHEYLGNFKLFHGTCFSLAKKRIYTPSIYSEISPKLWKLLEIRSNAFITTVGGWEEGGINVFQNHPRIIHTHTPLNNKFLFWNGWLKDCGIRREWLFVFLFCFVSYKCIT